MRTGLPSASKAELAMICSASAVLPYVRRESGHADSGRWKHAFVQALAGGAEPEAALAAVPPEFHAACEAVDASVVRGLSGIAELALVYDVDAEKVRVLGTDIGRAYGDLAPSEMPMSIDYASLTPTAVVIVDLKTGRGFVPGPARNWQLRINALALARAHGRDEAEVALALAPEGQRARFEVARLDAFDLADTAEALRALARRIAGGRHALAKGEVPHLTTGEHCRNCPSRAFCPATASLAKRLAGEPEKVAADIMAELTAISAAKAWGALKAAKAVLADVESTLYAAAAESRISLGNGRWLGQRETRREQLDGHVVHLTLEALHGRAVADLGVELEASKAGVKRALRTVYEARKAGGEKVTLSALEAQVLGAVRDAGGTTVRVSTTIGEYSDGAAVDVESPPLQLRQPEPPPPSDADMPF